MLFRALAELGLLLALVFSPFLFLAFYWTDRSLTSRQWAVVIGLLFLGAVLMHTLVVSLLAAAVLIAIGLGWLWHKVVLLDVTYDRRISQTHLFPGDEATITWELVNDKPLPISWFRWREVLPGARFGSREPDGLDFEQTPWRRLAPGRDAEIDQVASLRSYGKLRDVERVRALRRGYYRFASATVHASDALGLFVAEKNFGSPELALTVYPKLSEFDPLELDIKGLLGDWRQRKSLVEDPVWYRGDREYQAQDPIRFIDWRSSARGLGLQVKTFEPTTHPKLMILVNLHMFERISSGWMTENMEEVISLAASLSSWALQCGYEVGIHSNGALPGVHAPFRILPSAADNQLFTVLEYLARIAVVVSRPIEETLNDLRDLPYGTSVLICSTVITQGLMLTLHEKWGTRNVALVLVNNEADVQVPGIRVIHSNPRTPAA